ncbi:unnamed protein product [Caenorhabditis angaria]|uniref:Uncharacterized protein n=1 Tax=Caenorhabditis angaria TaxID=860376 RepID=A0A9P1IXH1_9PELO|nr:unnamed protein product [Caenorhabditis angaria]
MLIYFLLFLLHLILVYAGQIPVHPIFSPCNFPSPIKDPTVHKTVCHTIPRLPFVCDLHHQLAYTNTHAIEKAYSRYKSVFTEGNTSTLAVIIVKQLEQPVEANDVMTKREYACLFDTTCQQIDGDVITGMAGNVRMFLKVYAWKVFERWFRHSPPEECGKANLLALLVLDGVVNDARKIPYVRLHAPTKEFTDNLSNIQAEVTNALLQGWPLAKSCGRFGR